MGATTAAMVTAVVGVLGTLLAPVIANWTTKRQRAEESRVEERRRTFEDRRAAYTAMNRAFRHFHTMLKDALHRLRDGSTATRTVPRSRRRGVTTGIAMPSPRWSFLKRCSGHLAS